MGDRELKDMVRDVECTPPETTTFTKPPPLDEATVAIVTSASLHHADQDDYAPHDPSFRVLDGNRDDLVLGHWSPGLDFSGFGADPNVVFPIDRLRELAERGRIGRVADHHLAYAGNQPDLSGLRLDTGPAGAKLLRDEGVDVVLFTPV